MNKKSVLILGYHGMANMGDDVFLSVAARMASSMGYERALVSARNNSVPTELHGVAIEGFEPDKYFLTRRFKWLHVFLLASRVDKIIFCAGSLFSVSPFVLQRWVFLAAKLFFSVEVSAVGVSIGPFYSESKRRDCLKLLNVFDSIIFRDEPSYKIGKSELHVGVRQKLSYDIAALYKVKESKSCKVAKSIALCLNNVSQLFDSKKMGDLPRFVSSVIDGVYQVAKESDFEITLIATCSDKLHGDQVLATKMQECFIELGVKTNIHLYENCDPDRTIGLIANTDAIIASRMHAGVFAMHSRVPLLQLSYAPKIEALFERLDLPVDNLFKTEDVKSSDVSKFLQKALSGAEYDRVEECYEKLNIVASVVKSDLEELGYQYNV